MKKIKSFLKCDICLSHNYKLKNRKIKEIVKLKKYCKHCRKITQHIESF